jgi:hypothetical protein
MSLAAIDATEPARIGEVVHEVFQTPHPYPASGAAEPRLTWSDQVVYPGATYISLHFARFELAAGDEVVVRSPDGTQRWVYRGRGRRDLGVVDGGFFATHIRGDSAIVELYSAGSTNAYGYQIDYYGRGYSPDEIAMMWALGIGAKANVPDPTGVGESVCTTDDTREAKCYQDSEPEAYDKARAVSRLLVSGSALCTGWLVGSAGHLMTNEHCISSQGELDSIDFEFMAEGATCQTNCSIPPYCPGIIEASGGTFVTDDAALDYALVVPDTSVGGGTNLPDTYGYMRLRQTGAVINERIYHPQHPAGWGKRFGMESSYVEDVTLGGYCYATSLSEEPCSGGPGDVGYWTDTQGGSSGSPVLGYSDHKVVAIHHCRGNSDCVTGNPNTDDRNRGVPIDAIIADLGSLLPPGAVCDPFAGPATMSASPAGDNRVDLVWDAVAGTSISYQVYRTVGACPQPAFERIATGLTATSYSDTTVSGGTTYAYRVTAFRGDLGCESDPSNCDDATATGLCTWPPDFGGVTSVVNQQTADCGIGLGWSAASLHCGAGVVYNVYRSESGGFVPGPDSLLASCVSGVSYLDSSVASGVRYYYVVRAEDDSGNGSGPCGGGNEEDNLEELSALPTGPDEVLFADDMEAGPGNWTTGGSGGTPWTLVTSSSHSPSHAWFCADVASVADQRLITATAADLSSAPSGRLSFWHRYDLESSYDGGVLEYSVDAGTSWYDILAGTGGTIPANPDRFLQGGYTSTISSSYQNPLGGRQAWSGAATSWAEVIVDLTDFAGEMVLLRWRLGCDSSVSDVGWWVDDVSVLQGSECASVVGLPFTDGFESGDWSRWSGAVP